MTEHLRPDESELSGAWVATRGGVHADDTCRHIEWLRTNVLKRIASDSSGWDTLYRDPNDGRLWELVYLQSEMHGGGPPTLRVVEPATAEDHYGIGG